MKIIDAICSPGLTGFYFDDQKAIKQGALMDGFMYKGESVTDKFTAIRQPGESLSIMLILEDGSIAHGDAAAVQYSGTGGRDPLFLASEGKIYFEQHIKPRLLNLDVTAFKKNAEYFDTLVIENKRLHTAMRYGITQALLDATAKANRVTMPEIIRKEYHIKKMTYEAVPLFAQSGDERYSNVDKMIIKEVDVMPHALINNIDTKLGHDGEILKEYVKWLRNRIVQKRMREDYEPILHIDVYGTIGIIFDYNYKKMFNYLKELSLLAAPFLLRIEGPVDEGNREGTMLALKKLREMIDEDDQVHVEIVADEWCNTLEDVIYFTDNLAGHMVQVKTPDLGGVNNIIEALLYCRKHNMGAYSGGTCNETNISAEVTTSIAIACEAKQCLAKPGMGADEGIMIVKNHMARTLALIERNQKNNA
ncbi:methylaspartate ammonia-lyase [Liberiplasma polymorphum]|uniref:methylaspartate ammonia-lyase n=1 Tax=Liberiplasma polymorphum TaxID=3374570 RepID=UPI003774F91F